MFRSLLGSPIKTESLVSEDSSWFSLYLCKILGQSDVAFRRYERKSSELLDILYTVTYPGKFILVLFCSRHCGGFLPFSSNRLVLLSFCLPHSRAFMNYTISIGMTFHVLVFSISNFAEQRLDLFANFPVITEDRERGCLYCAVRN